MNGDNVEIEVVETRKIPIDSIMTSNMQARQTQVTKNLEIFAGQIQNIGLIQPIVVYQDGDKYELIVGQRRYYAHKDILQWNEILAMIIKKPKDGMMTATISWLENEARQKMANKDKIRHVASLYSQRISQAEIARTLGITAKEVRSCIGLPRVPDIVRESVESGEIAPDVALVATDAKQFTKYDTHEEIGQDVLELARSIQSNKLTGKQKTNLKDFGENNSGADNETLLKDGIENTSETISIDLSSSDSKRLKKYADNNDHKTPGAAAAQLVLEGLEQSGE